MGVAGTSIWFVTAWLTGAYLLGSIPTGLILGKLYGIDVRTKGSGNIGATNIYRTVGKKVGVLTLLFDCLKGLAPVLAARYSGVHADLAALIGLAAFCGHVFSIFLIFKGGKGVATALGVFLGLAPLALLVSLFAFIVIVVIWRYVSLGSIIAAGVMPVAIGLFHPGWILLLVSVIIATIIIIKHHENIKRLISGTENRFKA